MPLINCPECNKQISDQAPTCPNCGYPITAYQGPVSHSRKVTTIEKTCQKYKIQMVAAIALMLFSIFSCMVFLGIKGPGGSEGLGGPVMFSGFLFWVGLIWFFVVRILTWWHHG